MSDLETLLSDDLFSTVSFGGGGGGGKRKRKSGGGTKKPGVVSKPDDDNLNYGDALGGNDDEESPSGTEGDSEGTYTFPM